MTEDKPALIRAMARLVACRKQVQEHREGIQKHASRQLDHTNTAIRIASEHLRDHPNVLTYRYARARMTDGQRLRSFALRAEGERASARDAHPDTR